MDGGHREEGLVAVLSRQKNGPSFSLGSECLVRMIRTSYTYT